MTIGTDTYLFERTTPWSIAFWVKVKTFPSGSGGHIFSEYLSSGSYRGRLVRIDGGFLRFWLINQFSTNELKVNYIPPSRGRWVRVVITYSGNSAASGVKCYYNGVLQTQVSATETLSATIVATGVTAKWGGWGGAGVNLAMRLAKPAIIAHEMTAQEVADDWNDSAWSGTAPTDYYDLTEGSGTTVASSGSGAHNGTLGAGVTWDSSDTPGKARSAIAQSRLPIS